jgi:anti-anti-sigma factor
VPSPQVTDLALVISDEPGRLVVSVRGEVDLYTGPALHATLVDLVAGGASRLVIDARHISFLDSSGLSSLLDVASALADVGGRLELRAPTKPVLRVLELAGDVPGLNLA